MNDKHRPEHDNWDAGGHCNALVLDEYGYGEVCGYRAPTAEPSPAAPRIFGGILPYEAEVAEPDGPRIAAWVLADYADRADAIFQKWLAKHDAEVAAKALRDVAGGSIPRGALARETRSWLRDRARALEVGND